MKNTRYQLPQTLTVATLALSLFLAAGCAPKKEEGKTPDKPAAGGQAVANTPFVVRVGAARKETVTRYVIVTGNVAALDTVNLSPKLSAKVVFVAGREGTPVKRGEVVVRQDSSDFTVQLQQAQANLQASRARLAQAESGVKSAQVRLQQAKTQTRLQVTQSQAGVQDAEQQIKAAKSQLEIAKRPQRTQEIAVAENSVAQAQANYDKAKSDRERYEGLLKEGAIAQVTVDQYINQERVTKAALDSAKQQLDLANTGGREESIRNAETAVARAEWQLRLAKSNQGQVTVREDDIKAAEAAIVQSQAEVRAASATVQQNQAAVANAELQLANTATRSPINGVISARLTEPGQMAGPTASVATLVTLDTVYFEAQLPETDLVSVRQGQLVTIRVDAYPGKTFTGKVGRLYPTGDSASRTVIARIEIPNSTRALKPGLYARGEIVAEQRQGVVIPVDALVTVGNDHFVFVAEDGARAVQRKVSVGIQTPRTVEILSGVSDGESVIIAGKGGLKDGAPIKIEGGQQQTASL
jgi:RND family efflux transporter MFP subunit